MMDIQKQPDQPKTTKSPGNGRLVMKFGGTSLADIAAMERAAGLIAAEAQRGMALAVVVSAMAGQTDRLDALAREAGLLDETQNDRRDYDPVMAAGEQISSGLMALILRRMGFNARAWQGWQVPILTTGNHACARVLRIPENPLGEAIDKGEIAIIAGYQGVSEDGAITTLGRGGSDLSAVAIAAALKAESCDIYTDVDGVYTTDPRMEPQAKRIDQLCYEEMLELASMGAKVLQTRSVGLAMNSDVPVRVLSSMMVPQNNNPGTKIIGEEQALERQVINGVTADFAAARISALAVPDEAARTALMFKALARENINIDMIVQAPSRTPAAANISFSLSETDLARAQEVLAHLSAEIGYEELHADRSVAKVSVIGIGMKSHAGVAATMFQTLADENIKIYNITTSEIKISVLIEAQYTALAVQALHSAYKLDQPPPQKGE